MIVVTLVWDSEHGASDVRAQNVALRDIIEVERCTDEDSHFIYLFANATYLNEWRIAVANELSGLVKLRAIYPSTSDIQVFDEHGKADVWPDEVSIWDSQLDHLLSPL